MVLRKLKRERIRLKGISFPFEVNQKRHYGFKSGGFFKVNNRPPTVGMRHRSHNCDIKAKDDRVNNYNDA